LSRLLSLESVEPIVYRSLARMDRRRHGGELGDGPDHVKPSSTDPDGGVTP